MAITRFPPLESADRHGLLAVGGDLDVESLLLAYRSGIFPWPLDEELLAWFSPPQRALIFLDDLHVSASLRRQRNRARFTFRFDSDFPAVIHACSELVNRKGQRGTWVTPSVIEAYCEMHRRGFAHSVEAYNGDTLVGGVYGIAIGSMFAAESMFYREPYASKLALLTLLEHLKSRGAQWVDCQVETPVSRSFGSKKISREKFMSLLERATNSGVNLF